MFRLLSRLIAHWFPKAQPAAVSMRAVPRNLAISAGARLKADKVSSLARRSHKPRLMAVDPDPAVLNFISAIASPWYSVIGARDPGWAKAWLFQHKDIVACVAGDKLSAAHSVDLLDRCRIQQPSMLRVLVTANIDGADTVRALLAGTAHRLVESPMCKENLGPAIDPRQLQASVTVTDRRKLLAA